MEQTYLIEWLEEKQAGSYGLLYELSLKDSKGVQLAKVAAWPKDWPQGKEWKPGQQINGVLFTKQNAKGFTNTTIYPPKEKKAGGFSGARVEKIMEKKAEYIEKAQERKNDSIAYFNSLNSAITLVGTLDKIADLEGTGDAEGIKTAIKYWRDWFLQEWKSYDAGDYQDKHNAF